MNRCIIILSRFYLLLMLLATIACQQTTNKGNAKETEVKSIHDSVKVSQDTVARQPDTLIFSDPKLSDLVKETENFFERYDTIRLSDTYSINQLKLPKKLRRQLTSVEKDSVDGMEVIDAIRDLIDENIQKILKWKGIEQYDISLVFRNCLYVVKSPDRKLYSLSFDAKTGGSYKSRISYIYYITDKGTPISLYAVSESENGVFNQDGYSSIDTINTKEGTKYLLMGSVVGCNSCFGYYVDLVQYKKGEFITDFNYKVDSSTAWYHPEADGSPLIEYDSKQRKIYISYNTDSLTPGCNCGTYGSIATNDEYDENKVKSVDCVYTFNGKSFKLTKKKVVAVKPKP